MTAVAQERLAARRRRFSRIRRWIAGAAVAVFIAAFSTLYVQMATGHDPALANKSSASTTASTSNSTGTTSSSSTPSAVTTQQS